MLYSSAASDFTVMHQVTVSGSVLVHSGRRPTLFWVSLCLAVCAMHENAFLHSKSAKAAVQGSLYVTIFALHKFFSDLLFKFLIDLLS